MVLQGSVLAKKTDGDWSRALPVTYVLVTPPILLSNAQQAVTQRCGTVDDGHTVTGVFMPLQNKIS